MEAQDIFLGVLFIFVTFNIFLVYMQPGTGTEIALERFIGFIAGILFLGVLTGITVLGTGLSTESIKIIFGVGAILNILFSLQTPYFSIGLGLATDTLAQFSATDGLGVGYMIVTFMSIVALISGLIIITD